MAVCVVSGDFLACFYSTEHEAPKRMLFGLNFGLIIFLNLPLFVLMFPPFLSLMDASPLLFPCIRLPLSVKGMFVALKSSLQSLGLFGGGRLSK